MKIYHAVSIEEILNMYPVYHEMDISKFVEVMDEKWNQYYVETNLKRLRTLAGLSQSELAKRTGVSIRQIQLFEQRQRDINHTKAIDVKNCWKYENQERQRTLYFDRKRCFICLCYFEQQTRRKI